MAAGKRKYTYVTPKPTKVLKANRIAIETLAYPEELSTANQRAKAKKAKRYDSN